MFTRFFGVFLLLSVMATMTYGQEEWQKEKDKNNIQVFTRFRDGYKIKEFKAVTEINAPAEKTLEVILAADSFDGWMSNIKNSKILRELKDNQILTYYQISVPWPMQNRDAIGDMQITASDSGYQVKITVLNDYLPEYPRLVRMHDAEGFWDIQKLSDESCHVTYQFVADPEGSVPAWIANMFVVDGPYQTLLNLRGILE